MARQPIKACIRTGTKILLEKYGEKMSSVFGEGKDGRIQV